MLKWLLPQETCFYDYFEAHAAILILCAQELQKIVSSDADIATRAIKMKELEHEADIIAHNCIEALHKTFITPFDRTDILRLVSQLDDIIDFAENTAARITIYKVKAMTSEVKELADILVLSTQEVHAALVMMRDPKKTELLRNQLRSINKLENEADVVYRRALGRLFDKEKDVLEIIKWKEIYEDLENSVDSCEKVANIIEGVLLESG